MRKFLVFQKEVTMERIGIALKKEISLTPFCKINGYDSDDEELETIIKQQAAEGVITDDALLACRFMALGIPVGVFQKGCVSMQWEPVNIQPVHLWVFEPV